MGEYLHSLFVLCAELAHIDVVVWESHFVIFEEWLPAADADLSYVVTIPKSSDLFIFYVIVSASDCLDRKVFPCIYLRTHLYERLNTHFILISGVVLVSVQNYYCIRKSIHRIAVLEIVTWVISYRLVKLLGQFV